MWFQCHAFNTLATKDVKELTFSRDNYKFFGTSTDNYSFFAMYNGTVSWEDLLSQNIILVGTISDHTTDL
jgi:hypothetical protein